ncbi:ADP-forming succinate--CoA ligase subunit beta [Helicobacter trogontum]|uniref:Succinate--CoA ligase [ADP-forming] subunit beta n=1 Tax=Helicobacter trogontum TaxID=50960 RepID=A0A4U8S5P7_9HELI|nr:ADP-forming succinate--CoA ligase subunit beta [Helicobacter trogontum]TLD81184.1 ADP-forming succinate--CoA ligase subunit beta [Helicobacter trogontum]
MNIHEYQGKQVLRKYGVATPRGRVANNGYEAKAIANELGGSVWVVKAQIHAGGRGKAGGVKLAKSLDEVATLTDSMLGMTLVTHQTGPSGKKVGRVYIEEGLDIKKEFYIAVVLDRGLEMPIFIASTEGGMEIEEVAERSPEKIIKVAIDPTIGFRSFHALELALGLGLTKEQQKPFSQFAKSLYDVFINEDAEQVEINPMILTGDGSFLALDAKLGFDNNALYRHSDIVAMRDFTEEELSEIEASESNLSYVKLEGNVGCMVNGAGLAMATMDIIKYEGGQPANFLDVGGGANPTTVAKGFEIILKDKNVKAIFVNIFGGIVQCDRVANGIIEATKLTSVEVPVVVRLDGTNAEKAKEILKTAGIKNLIAAENLKDGAQKVVTAAK